MEDEMTELEKRDKGLLYDANYNSELLAEQAHAKDLCFAYNQLMPSDIEGRQKILKDLFGQMGQDCTINAPFYCDYGYQIEMGDAVFINHNCVILDAAKVVLGSHVFIAPNCGFYTAGHPLDITQRNQGLEYAKPITIGDNVWLGAAVHVLPGVTIGDGTVIGAGSLIRHDIPSGVLAAGNPCRIIRKL